jgi:hypothetical protein
MSKTGGIQSPARQALAKPVSFEVIVAKLGTKDRQNVDRHLAAAAAEPDAHHAKLWKRIFSALATLAPHAMQTTGQQAVQFFIADGKYKKQVFALEDPRDGRLMIYTEDIQKEAVKSGVLIAPRVGTEPTLFGIKGQAGQTLMLESLDAANTPNPSPFYKHMLGWNRKALRITLPTTATPAQIAAVEGLLAIAAQNWPVAVEK